MKLPRRTKRVILYTVISVLAYFGPGIYPNPYIGESGVFADPRSFYPTRSPMSQFTPRSEWTSQMEVNFAADQADWERSAPQRAAQYELMVESVGPVGLGSAMRNMLFCSFFQTLTYLGGSIAGIFHDVSEFWYAQELAEWAPVGNRHQTLPAVRFFKYVGKWAGWWLFLALVSLPIRFVKFINSTGPLPAGSLPLPPEK